MKHKDGMGFVYVIENEIGLIKIGTSINPGKRIKTIEGQTGLSITNKFLSPKCSNYYFIERVLHKRFDEARKHGEWFKANFNEACKYLMMQEFDFNPPIRTPSNPEEIISLLDLLLPEASDEENYIDRIDFHCDICRCPKDLWSPLESYQSDRSCELYDDFGDIVFNLEQAGKQFNYQDILNNCQALKENYLDLPDISAAVREMVNIYIETGAMPDAYCYAA